MEWRGMEQDKVIAREAPRQKSSLVAPTPNCGLARTIIIPLVGVQTLGAPSFTAGTTRIGISDSLHPHLPRGTATQIGRRKIGIEIGRGNGSTHVSAGGLASRPGLWRPLSSCSTE